MAKNVLVTGGSGFIGHKLVQNLLLHRDHNLVLVDRLDHSGNLNRLSEVFSELQELGIDWKSRVKFIYHDLKAPISKQLREQIGPIQIIYHLAAQSHVDRSILYPLEFLQDNTVGTCNLLEYSRELSDLEMFLYFSTDEVFGPAPGQLLYGEYSRQNPLNPYAASKAAGEQFCFAYHNTYKLPLLITRTMNCFGVRQHPEKFIPKVIQKVLKGELVEIHSSPDKKVSGSRFYISQDCISDACMFIERLGPNLQTQNTDGVSLPIYNLVGAEETSNLDLANMIADSIGLPLKYEMVDFHSQRPGHDLRYGLDGSLLRELGWHPKTSVSSKIKEITDWYLKNPKWLLG